MRATTPEQRREVVERLLAVWERHPELRLGQLVCSAGNRHDPFYTEDFELVEKLENALGEREQ